MSKKAQGRRRVIAILTAVALLLTGSMIFTYWSSGITGATEEGSGGVTIGAGGVVSTTVSLDDLTASAGGLIPLDILLGTDEVHSVTLETDAAWEDENKAATGETGELFIALTGIKVNDVAVPLGGGIWNMFNVSPGGVYDIVCNGAAVPVSALISMNRPADKAEFDVIADARVEFEFEFEVVPEGGDRSLNNNDWADIKAAADVIAAYGESGAALEARVRDEFGFRIGDTKAYEISGETYHAQIMGFNHDEKTDGGKAGISFMNVELMANSHQINPTTTNWNIGGWDGAELRGKMQPTGEIHDLLPVDLASVITPVKKSTANGGNQDGVQVVDTADYLWLPSFVELHGQLAGTHYRHDGEGQQYTYWRNRIGANPTMSANVLRTKIKPDGSASRWWLRSPFAGNDASFCYLLESGAANSNGSRASYGVVLGFGL